MDTMIREEKRNKVEVYLSIEKTRTRRMTGRMSKEC
jgi:hypothetical protein